MRKKTKNTWVFESENSIKTELNGFVSKNIIGKIETSKECLLIKKRITYSDLVNTVKYCGKTENSSPSKYINFYLTEQEIKENNITYGAKQSNIGIDRRLFDFYGMKKLQRRNGKEHKEKNHKHERLNDYTNVFLYNDHTKDFETSKTVDVLKKLNKRTDKVGKIQLPKEELIPLQISQAIHGLGIAEDNLFHELRKNTFWNDIMYFLCLTNELIVIPKRNAKFYSVLGEVSPLKAQYINMKLEKQANLGEKRDSLSYKVSIDEEIDRKFQASWRNALAEEMMNYSSKEGYVMCPITGIEVDFDKVGTLFRASHIKGYAESNDEEKFDINNGLLMVASADALFDKHLFTINDNGDIQTSFYIESNVLFRLGFTQNLYKPLLNEKRLEYLKYHKNKFELKERER